MKAVDYMRTIGRLASGGWDVMIGAEERSARGFLFVTDARPGGKHDPWDETTAYAVIVDGDKEPSHHANATARRGRDEAAIRGPREAWRDPATAPRRQAEGVMSAAETMPIRDMMMADDWYAQLDPGIRFAVRVLHAAGIETGQSCQGGEGHAYSEPTVDLPATGADATGFAALAALTEYGIRVEEVAMTWTVQNGTPYQKLWRIRLREPYPERAGDQPIFVYGYRATPDKPVAEAAPAPPPRSRGARGSR